MMSDDEIMEVIAQKLYSPLNDLWDVLTPEERKEAFTRLIVEYVEATF